MVNTPRSEPIDSSTPSDPLPSPEVAVFSLDTVPFAVPLPEAQPLDWNIPVLPQPSTVARREWVTGLFRCCDHCVPNGLMSCFCPCVSLPQIFVRMGSGRFKSTVAVMVCTWIAVLGTGVVFVLPLASDDDRVKKRHLMGLVIPVLLIWVGHAIVVVLVRKSLRSKFLIPSSPWEDVAAAFFCTPCAIAQAASQVKSYTPGSCSFRPPEVLPAFLDD